MKKAKLTSFEWRVLKATMKIPLGQTRSYQWVAKMIGHPKAMRAVGSALRKNPYLLIIPCHRVIRGDGKTGGYAGIERSSKKIRLLKQEKEILKNLHSIGRGDHHDFVK